MSLYSYGAALSGTAVCIWNHKDAAEVKLAGPVVAALAMSGESSAIPELAAP